MSRCLFTSLLVVLLGTVTSSAFSNSNAVPIGALVDDVAPCETGDVACFRRLLSSKSAGARHLLSTTVSNQVTQAGSPVFRQDDSATEDRIAGPRAAGTIKEIGNGDGKGRYFAEKAAEANRRYREHREEFDRNKPDHSVYYDGRDRDDHSKKP